MTQFYKIILHVFAELSKYIKWSKRFWKPQNPVSSFALKRTGQRRNSSKKEQDTKCPNEYKMTDSQEDKRLWKSKIPVSSFTLKRIGQRFEKREKSSEKEQDPKCPN